MATIQVNFTIDANIKAEAEAVFNNIGLTLNDALRMFVRQAVTYQGLPLATRLEDMPLARPVMKLTQGQTEKLQELLNNPQARQRMHQASEQLLSVAKNSKVRSED